MSRASSAKRGDQLEIGDVVLDRAAHLVLVSGQRVLLTLREFDLLDALMSNADHVLPTTDLLSSLWGPSFDGDPSTLAVHVLRLRNKIEREHDAVRHIRTVRGLGYIFDTAPV